MADVISPDSEDPGRPSSSGRPAILRPGEIFDPVARALEVIGDRWTLVLVRQLIGGAKGFQELRVRTGIAPRVLSSRLRQLADDGFVESVRRGTRSLYGVTERGRSLEPIISSIALWWTRHGIEDLAIDTGKFTETSPQSILESMPFLLREDVARDARVTFEIRLTGAGGGVWTVHIVDGQCEVRPGFAEGADVRYTADAKVWCSVALGLADARDAVKRELMQKEGGPQALDHYFHQISRLSADLSDDRPAAPDVSRSESQNEADPARRSAT
ncbi:MAG: transcriptional regulator [Deltaproteobacteria bacterium]|nr:transcriptional regulator [Deltaproteobacteria bacterium]MBW2420841.1 transcriptional regulator [Deltaproteobacteria bacterium]